MMNNDDDGENIYDDCGDDDEGTRISLHQSLYIKYFLLFSCPEQLHMWPTYKERPWRPVAFETFDQSDEETWPETSFDNFDSFWQLWHLWTNLTIFDTCWQFFRFLTIFTSTDNLTILDNFGQFLQFWIILTMIIPETCCLWDIDYNSDNWEPKFVTLFMTWQFRVSLDRICNSCDVSFHWMKNVLAL